MTSKYILVRVKHQVDFGYWEVNLLEKRALFRDNKSLPPDNLPLSSVVDLSDKYETIEEYLNKGLRLGQIKTIIPSCKVIYSKDNNTPICQWFRKKRKNDDETDHSFSPLQCENLATTQVEEGVFMCDEHSGIDRKEIPDGRK